MSTLYVVFCVACFGLGVLSKGPNSDFFFMASIIYGIASTICGKLDKLK